MTKEGLICYQGLSCGSKGGETTHFSTVIVSVDSNPMALFQVSCTFLDRGGLEVPLKSHAKEFAQHLSDKVTQIH